jgi:Cu(I)/Ag(I) efflux system membrane fusion protein
MMVAFLVAGVVGAGGYGLYQAGMHKGQSMAVPGPATAATKVDPATGRKVLYWHDPMVPGKRFDKPGKSPFMDMQLVPVYADDAADNGDKGGIAVSQGMRQNLGIRTAEVRKGSLDTAVEMSPTMSATSRWCRHAAMALSRNCMCVRRSTR